MIELMIEEEMKVNKLYKRLQIPSDQILVQGELARAWKALLSRELGKTILVDEARQILHDLRKKGRLVTLK